VSESAFRVQLFATHPEGRGRVKLDIEACPTGTAFGNISCVKHVGASWTDTTAAANGVVLTETITGLSPDTLYRWRARVLHAPLHVTSVTAPPNPAHGPWRRPTAQSVEADVRTSAVPEPGLGAAIASGVAAIALGSGVRRRRARI
jgi:hypothetical protein